MTAPRTSAALPALVFCGLLACGPEPEAAEPSATWAGAESQRAPAPASPPPSAPSESTADEADDDAVLSARPMTMGGRQRPVWLGSDGVLHVGSRTATVEGFAGPDAHPEDIWRQASLAVVTFDAELEAIVLTLPTQDEEDPPNHYRVWLPVDGELRLVFDQVVGAYGVQPIVLPGDGTVRYVEDGWAACDRLEHPARATRQEVVHRWRDGGMREERSDTERVQRCDQLAACPFVYRLEGDEETLVGEVLRDIRGRENAALQPLAIGAVDAGLLRLRLREEKEEVSFVDELYAEVDGVRLDPVRCARQGGLVCAADGRHHVLRPGDALDLAFELPSAGEVTLWARGYYVPTPTAATR